MGQKNNDPAVPKPLTLHTCALTAAQAQKLRAVLAELGWVFEVRQYMLFFGQKDRLTVAVYEKGPKVVVQGRGTEEFVRFTLEPEVLGEARLGYEEVNNPEMFQPHFGVDESGKGDFFGPLVIAGAYTDAASTRALMDAGIQDSKRIGSDARIRELAKMIREMQGVVTTVVQIGPQKYNELYGRFRNLNRLLAWGHAQVIENLLKQRPDCPRALSDQFANPVLIKRALAAKNCVIQLDARTKAESDVAVAAASILARESFINWLLQAGRKYGTEIGRGVSSIVKEQAKKLVAARGPEFLSEVAKVHFKTAAEIAPDFYKVPTEAAS